MALRTGQQNNSGRSVQVWPRGERAAMWGVARINNDEPCMINVFPFKNKRTHTFLNHNVELFCTFGTPLPQESHFPYSATQSVPPKVCL